MFVVYQLNTDMDMQLAFGDVKDGSLFLTTVQTSEFVRYEYVRGELTYDGVVGFIDDFRNKRLEVYYLSEKVHPEDRYLNDSNVLIVTGKQFREKIVKRDYNYLVLFCNDGARCRYAKILFKYVEKLNRFDTILRLAYMNSDKNEVEGLKIDKLPSVALFSHGSKNKPRRFELDIKVGQLTSWLNVEYYNGRRTSPTCTSRR